MSALPTDLCRFPSGLGPASSLCDPGLPTPERLEKLIWSGWEEAANKTLDGQSAQFQEGRVKGRNGLA